MTPFEVIGIILLTGLLTTGAITAVETEADTKAEVCMVCVTIEKDVETKTQKEE